MATIFRRLHRLRKLEERTAQVALAEAHAHRESCEAEVVEIQDRLDRSHRVAANDLTLLAQHHRFALEGELGRRTAVRELESAHDGVREAHDQVVSRAQQARTVELLAESSEERTRRHARQVEQRTMDEVGAQRWLRRVS